MWMIRRRGYCQTTETVGNNNGLTIWHICHTLYMEQRKGGIWPAIQSNSYEDEQERKPVEEFLGTLDIKMRAKVVRTLEILQANGPKLREPYSKHLEDGIFEIRVRTGSNITRVLYFFYFDGKIILTNGFVKKTQKTPTKELKLAKKRRNHYLERKCNS